MESVGGWLHTHHRSAMGGHTPGQTQGAWGRGSRRTPLCFWSFPGAENTEGKDKNLTEPTPLPAEDRAKVCWKAVLSRREVHVVQVVRRGTDVTGETPPKSNTVR